MSSTHNVLVIDDDEIMLAVIEELLEAHGYHVVTMASPIGATRTILKENIHLVVVDWRMPVMEGDRLVGLLRTWERVRELPVVLISGDKRESLERVARGLSGVSIVSKSQMDDELPAAVNAGLGGVETETRRYSTRPTTAGASIPAAAVESFYDRLAKRLREASELWQVICGGDGRHRELDFLIDMVHGQAQLLALSEMANLIAEIHSVTRKVAEGGGLTPLVRSSVSRALHTAATLPGLQEDGIQVDLHPVIAKLRAASQSLSA